MKLFPHLEINSLSLVEQDIYRFLSNNFEKIPYMRVRDIAKETGVSSTSVFRFIKKAGYNSFPEFRFQMNLHLKQRKHTDKKILSLEECLSQLKINNFHPDIEHQIQGLANNIAISDFTLIMGLGTSGAMAHYMARKIANLGYNCLALEDLTYPIQSLLERKRKNTLIFLSISGETKELIEVLLKLDSFVNNKKYCLTQSKDSTLARMCNYSLEYNVEEDRKNFFYDMTTQIPVMLITDVLISHLKMNPKKLGT